MRDLLRQPICSGRGAPHVGNPVCIAARGEDRVRRAGHTVDYAVCLEGEIWAIQKNSLGSHVISNVMWTRPSPALPSIDSWHLEERQYTADWPSDPGKYQLYVRGTPSALGATVIIPAGLNPKKACLSGCEDPPNSAHLQQERAHIVCCHIDDMWGGLLGASVLGHAGR